MSTRRSPSNPFSTQQPAGQIPQMPFFQVTVPEVSFARAVAESGVIRRSFR
jgi:hypothetical protein